MLSRGDAVVEAFNALRPDAVELGNHDFDLGQARLVELVKKLKAPVLAANVYDAKTGKRPAHLQANVIKKVGGVKIGVFGLITAMRRNYIERNIEGLRLRPEVEEAKDQVAELKRRGATIIIALSHVGVEEPKLVFDGEKLIASTVPGIDVIIGGHTHRRLDEAFRDPKNDTMIVDTGNFLTHAGRVTLTIDRKSGRVVGAEETLQPLWVEELGEAADEAAIVARYRKSIGSQLDEVIGRSNKTLSRENWAESELGDWACDCMRQISGAEIAFQNSPSLRADMPLGDVTLRRMYEMMPFDNYIATTTLTGAQIRQVLEYAVSGATNIIQVSGLRFHYNPQSPPGNRIASVEVGGAVLGDTGHYRVVVPDFLLRGGDGYPAFAQGEGSSVSLILARDAFAGCVRRQSPVQPPEIGRIFKD
jgi:2',3'-cyclic-nucleotide 2'-phosphodiesterase (5'-nucleotidase family)